MRPGSVWRHYKGNEYVLICCCRLEATQEPHVVYKRAANQRSLTDPQPLHPTEGDVYGEYWCRPLAVWNEEVTPGQRRFTLVKP